MSVQIPGHAVMAWQKRFASVGRAKSKIREAYEDGIEVSVEGKSSKARFHPQTGAILVVRGETIKTVLFVENQLIHYKDDVYCANCGNGLSRSRECPRCGCELHTHDGIEFKVDW